MQAIQTKVLPATNTKPTRIKAWCQRGSIILSIEELGSGRLDISHILAAERLCRKFLEEDFVKYGAHSDNPWIKPIQTGTLPNGDLAHVFIE